MIKVLIADDEPHFRTYMQKVLDWKTLGFEITDIVKNGDEAMASVRRSLPDIALLDINMPGMDGITLTEEIKKLSDEIYVVFITGYSEFEYARKAVQLGVDEYILKPFSKEELTNILIRIKLNIDKSLEEKKHLKQERQIIQGELLEELITGQLLGTEEELKKQMGRVDVTFRQPYYLICAVEMDNLPEIWNQPHDVNLWKFGITNIIQELLESSGYLHYICNGNENRVLILLNMPSPAPDIPMLAELLQKASILIHGYFGFTITVGIGTIRKGLIDLNESYRDSLAALQTKFIEGPGRIIDFSAIKASTQKASFYRLQLNDELLQTLQKGDKAVLSNILRTTMHSIRENNFSLDYAYMMVGGMLSICLSYITEMQGDITQILGENFSPYQQLYSQTSLEDCFALLEEIFSRTMDAFKQPRSRRTGQILDAVESFISAHYHDPELTVEKIAAEIYLDSSYIRKLFSRYMGTTITDYITSARMKEARELLESSHLTIAEISERVGYSEAGYFSKCFKKFYGLSPKVYAGRIKK